MHVLWPLLWGWLGGEVVDFFWSLSSATQLILWISSIIILLTEDFRPLEDCSNRIFKVIFELCSCYGNVGMSLGTTKNSWGSFAYELKGVSQWVLIAVCFLGRMRDLPLHVDGALRFYMGRGGSFFGGRTASSNSAASSHHRDTYYDLLLGAAQQHGDTHRPSSTGRVVESRSPSRGRAGRPGSWGESRSSNESGGGAGDRERVTSRYLNEGVLAHLRK